MTLYPHPLNRIANAGPAEFVKVNEASVSLRS
jgi:hypothetical protein